MYIVLYAKVYVMSDSVEIHVKIVSINNSRYQITIPKKLIDSGIIDPNKEYTIKLVKCLDAGIQNGN